MDSSWQRWTGAYCALARSVPGLLGFIVNFPTDPDVMTGFFSEDSGAFEDAARRRRNTFLKQFDGIGEYWFRAELPRGLAKPLRKRWPGAAPAAADLPPVDVLTQSSGH